MAFSVEKIRAALAAGNGLQSPNKYRVRLYPPGALDVSANVLEFYCESANMPGMLIASTSVRPMGYGAQHEAPLLPIYEDVTLTYRLPNDSLVTTVMHDWQRRVVNHDYAPGEGGDRGAFLVSYADDFVGNAEITAFDQDGLEIRVVTLHRVWPKNVGAQSLSWSTKDQYATMTVTLAYRSWTTTDLRG